MKTSSTSVSLLSSLQWWTGQALAFWAAEVLGAVSPLDAEPLEVLASALGLYLSIAWLGAIAWHLLLRTVPALDDLARRPKGLLSGLDDRWYALLPFAILLVPKARIAIASMPSVAVGWAAWTILVATFFLWRRPPRDLLSSLAVGLAVWFPALRLKDLARAAELHSNQVIIGSQLAIGLSLIALAWACVQTALFGQRRGLRIATSIIAPSLLAARLLLSPAFDLDVERVEERLGRGTPVILIVMDTTRADHLSLYGYERATSPELEAFARDAVVFDNAISTSSWTLPAHASLFTGLLPLTHGALRLPGLDADGEELSARGIHRPAYPLPGDVPTLAEWLAGNDVATGAVVANFAYLDPAFGVGRGFDTYFAVRNTPIEPRILKVVHRHVQRLPWASKYWQVYRPAEQINQLAVRWLESQGTYRFFLFLNYMEPHLPWGPHQPGLRYDDFAAEAELPTRPRGLAAPEERFRRRVDLYDSNIASLDARLGELFEQLRRLELYDRSMIIVTADHGESFGENDADGHGKSLNESEIWVPLLIKYPDSRGAGRRDERVQLTDLLPTIAAELGRDFPADIEGRAVDQLGDEPVIAELYTDPREPADVFHGYRAALYEGDVKLQVRSDGRVTVFDRSTGLEHPVDLPPDLEAWVAERKAMLLERQQLLEERARSRQHEVELDPELEAGLKALGYI